MRATRLTDKQVEDLIERLLQRRQIEGYARAYGHILSADRWHDAGYAIEHQIKTEIAIRREFADLMPDSKPAEFIYAWIKDIEERIK